MSKILVVGGAGYIGGITCDILTKNGHEVTVYDNLTYEDRYFKPLKFINGDIRDTNKVVASATECDVVVLLAALVGDPACAINPGLTEEINFLAIKNICEALPKEKHVIFSSTCSVYGENQEMVDETSKTNPLSCYASTKLKAEKYVLDRGGTVFRLGTIFGVGDLFSRIRADLVVNTLTIKAFTENKITVNGGEQWRPIISVKDVGHYVNNACSLQKNGLYNLAYKNVKIYEIADDIVKVFPKVEVRKIDQMFQDTRNYKVDNSLSLKTFSHKPQISVAEEVHNLLELLTQGRIKNPNNILYNNGLFLSSVRI